MQIGGFLRNFETFNKLLKGGDIVSLIKIKAKTPVGILNDYTLKSFGFMVNDEDAGFDMNALIGALNPLFPHKIRYATGRGIYGFDATAEPAADSTDEVNYISVGMVGADGVSNRRRWPVDKTVDENAVRAAVVAAGAVGLCVSSGAAVVQAYVSG